MIRIEVGFKDLFEKVIFDFVRIFNSLRFALGFRPLGSWDLIFDDTFIFRYLIKFWWESFLSWKFSYLIHFVLLLNEESKFLPGIRTFWSFSIFLNSFSVLLVLFRTFLLVLKLFGVFRSFLSFLKLFSAFWADFLPVISST